MSDLHIPNLTIKNLRGIDHLEIPRLGRVTLLAGKNGVGKTTVLDAIRLYASRGDYATFHRLLVDRNQLQRIAPDGRQGISPFDWQSIFNAASEVKQAEISVSGAEGSEPLWIEQVGPGGVEGRAQWTNASREALQIRFRNGRREIPYLVEGETGHQLVPPQAGQAIFRVDGSRMANTDWSETNISCESLGPDLMKNREIARLWDSIALSNAEDAAIEALQLAYPTSIDRIVLVSDDKSSRDRIGRYPIVRPKHSDQPVSLRSLGDGAIRLFSIGLATAASADGLVLIDEVENGLHYSILNAFWSLLFHLADERRVQVVATTHSWDCVRSFAAVAVADSASEGLLYRLDRETGRLRAVQYREEKLMAAAKHHVEVR